MEDLPQKKIRGSVADESGGEEDRKFIEKCPNQHLTYDVLRIIFKHLNGMDMSSVSMVCRSWLEAANNEKRTRGPICFRECVACFASEKQSMEYFKSQIIKRLRIKPALGLFFTVSSMPFIKEDCHCKVLPTNCDTVTLGTNGIVIDDTEVENNVHQVVCAFLPEIPDVSIKTFTIGGNSTTKRDISKSMEKCTEEMKKVLTCGKNHGKSKCLLLFSDGRGCLLAVKIANALKRCYAAGELSVWGGVAKDLLVCNAKDNKNDQCGEFPFCVAITLTGPIDTWSVIVDKTCKTKERVEQRLKSFKERVCLKKHSMGFMFACCARGASMFDECNVESTIFKALFPEVPLVGCFGDGEFGENSIPSGSSSKKTTWYNETTTVFLIITYG
ncbi:F-box only protein 22-like [Andrena cerasifolii]|uniref:F-box only protein 22-like n=1 Tax=Andrena cerasifolii TaxID=2819439 RepID=UPI00403813B3